MRELTEQEIHSGGSAMPSILEQFRQLVGLQVFSLQPNTVEHFFTRDYDLVLSQQGKPVLVVAVQMDDEGNDGGQWRLNGSTTDFKALVGRSVVATGYYYADDQDDMLRTQTYPYIRFDDGSELVATGANGGGIIYMGGVVNSSWPWDYALACEFYLKS